MQLHLKHLHASKTQRKKWISLLIIVQAEATNTIKKIDGKYYKPQSTKGNSAEE